MPHLVPRAAWFCLLALIGDVGAIPLQAEEPGPGLRAGVARVDITPRELPIAVSGSFANRQATGVHDRLQARCLVLDNGQLRVAIVICDALLLTRDIFDAAKQSASKATGIPESQMLMAATHTHSGPAAVPLAQLQPDPKYISFLQEQLAAAVVEANRNLVPAKIAWAVAHEPAEVHNRRWFVKPEAIPVDPFGRQEDRVLTNPPRGTEVLLRPAGPVDPDVSIVSVQTRDGKPMALLANYSLHYVGGIPAGQLSADYFGEFDRQMRERLQADESFVGLLCNGTSGDINNIKFAQPAERAEEFQRVREVAGRIADVTLQALTGATYQHELSLAVQTRTLTLGVRRPDAQELKRAEARLAAAARPEQLTRDEVYAFEAVRLSRWPETVEVPLQVIRIGGLGITALPCEAFAEIGLEIKRHSPLRPTFTIGLANGYNGYLPTPGQHALGGYETWPCSWSYLEPEASVKITAAAVEMLHAVNPLPPGAEPSPAYALYFVVPRDMKTFTESVRQQLGVLGPGQTHWPERHRYRHRHGYLAWLTLPEAVQLGAHPEISDVSTYLSDDVMVGARPRGTERNDLDVFLSPNSWEPRVPPGKFQSAEALLADWKQRFAADSSLTFQLNPQTQVIRITIRGVKPDPQLSAYIRQSGQVHRIAWSGDIPD